MNLSGIELKADVYFSWDPRHRVVTYDPKRIETDQGRMMFLHELGHALLGHERLDEDRVYQMERAAWKVARELGQKLGLRSQERMIARKLKELSELGYGPS